MFHRSAKRVIRWKKNAERLPVARHFLAIHAVVSNVAASFQLAGNPRQLETRRHMFTIHHSPQNTCNGFSPTCTASCGDGSRGGDTAGLHPSLWAVTSRMARPRPALAKAVQCLERRALPSPRPRCGGVTPRFWIGPSPLRSRNALHRAAITSGLASSQVASGRKPDFRHVAVIRLQHPTGLPGWEKAGVDFIMETGEQHLGVCR